MVSRRDDWAWGYRVTPTPGLYLGTVSAHSRPKHDANGEPQAHRVHGAALEQWLNPM